MLGLMVCRGHRKMMAKLPWNFAVGLMSLVLFTQYLMLLGLPPGVGGKDLARSLCYSAQQWHRYFMLQPEVWRVVVCCFGVGWGGVGCRVVGALRCSAVRCVMEPHRPFICAFWPFSGPAVLFALLAVVTPFVLLWAVGGVFCCMLVRRCGLRPLYTSPRCCGEWAAVAPAGCCRTAADIGRSGQR